MADRSPPDRLNIASFKQRNSAITEDLERQEVERENLWKRLQAARAEGDQLRALAQRSTDEDLSASTAASPRAIATIHEAPEEEEPATPPREPTTPLEEAPTIAELLTVVSPERLAARIPSTEAASSTELGSPERPPPPPQAVPASSRFGRGGRGRHRSLPAAPPSETVLEGFVCPACFMRAPTQEVLQSHWEAVHQTNSDRFFDGARAAFRRVKRSMSQRPASTKATETAPPPPIRKAAVARRHTWEMELVKWRQHALV